MEGQKLAADLTEGIHQTAAAITKSVHEGAIADFKMGLEGWIKAQMEAIRDDKVERAWDHLRLTSVMREKLVRFTETDFEITTVRQAADVAKVITTIEQHAYQLLDEATGLGKLNEMMSAIERALPQDDAIDVDPSE